MVLFSVNFEDHHDYFYQTETNTPNGDSNSNQMGSDAMPTGKGLIMTNQDRSSVQDASKMTPNQMDHGFSCERQVAIKRNHHRSRSQGFLLAGPSFPLPSQCDGHPCNSSNSILKTWMGRDKGGIVYTCPTHPDLGCGNCWAPAWGLSSWCCGVVVGAGWWWGGCLGRHRWGAQQLPG